MIKSHSPNAFYSPELLDSFPNQDDIPRVSFPQLAPLFRGFVHRFIESGESDYGIGSLAETLVDGADLDEKWCLKHMRTADDRERQFALRLVLGKRARLDYIHPEGPTCYVHGPEEAGKIQRLPGRDE